MRRLSQRRSGRLSAAVAAVAGVSLSGPHYCGQVHGC